MSFEGDIALTLVGKKENDRVTFRHCLGATECQYLPICVTHTVWQSLLPMDDLARELKVGVRLCLKDWKGDAL